MDPFTVVVLALTISLLVYLLGKYGSARSVPLPPGPKGMQATCELIRAAMSGTLYLEAEKWAEQYGDIVLCDSPGKKLVFLNSSDAIRQTFADKSTEQDTNDRPQTFSGWFVMNHYRDIVLGSPDYSGRWAKLRRLFHTTTRFYGDGVERFESMVQVELRRLVERIKSRPPIISTTAEHVQPGITGHDDYGGRGPGGRMVEVEMTELVSHLLLCVLAVLLTGECPSPESVVVQRIKEFDRAVNLLLNPSTEGVLTAFPWLRHLPGYYRDVCRNVSRTKQALLDTLTHQMKKPREEGKTRGIVDVLLAELNTGRNEWLSDVEVDGIVTDIVIAAFLTSRETLLSVFLCLLHHPEVTRKVQQEVDQTLAGTTPQVQDRSRLPYTEAVVLETLRYSSFFPLGVPHVCRHDVTVRGMLLPKGSLLFANIWVAHRNPRVFADPLNFRPERFLDEAGDVIPATHPLRQNLLPFGVGRRSCPGENFARSRVFLFVVTLLQHFDLMPPTLRPMLPLRRDSWEGGAVLQLKPYYCVLRQRS